MKYDLVTAEALDKYVSPGVKRTWIYLWVRDEQRKRKRIIIKNWYPYFFIKPEESFVPSNLRRTTNVTKDLFGEEVQEVQTNLSGDVGQLRRYFDKHWQADVLPEIAYLVKKKIYASFEKNGTKLTPCAPLNIPFRLCFMDMEVDATADRFPEAEEAREQIVSLAAWDSYRDYWTLFVWRADQTPRVEMINDNTEVRIFH